MKIAKSGKIVTRPDKRFHPTRGQLAGIPDNRYLHRGHDIQSFLTIVCLHCLLFSDGLGAAQQNSIGHASDSGGQHTRNESMARARSNVLNNNNNNNELL